MLPMQEDPTTEIQPEAPVAPVEALDVQGKPFKVGQKVAVADKLFRVDGLYVKIKKVTAIKGNKIYLDGSNRPLNFPDRVCIVR